MCANNQLLPLDPDLIVTALLRPTEYSWKAWEDKIRDLNRQIRSNSVLANNEFPKLEHAALQGRLHGCQCGLLCNYAIEAANLNSAIIHLETEIAAGLKQQYMDLKNAQETLHLHVGLEKIQRDIQATLQGVYGFEARFFPIMQEIKQEFAKTQKYIGHRLILVKALQHDKYHFSNSKPEQHQSLYHAVVGLNALASQLPGSKLKKNLLRYEQVLHKTLQDYSSPTRSPTV